jgi:hypothetical protein
MTLIQTTRVAVTLLLTVGPAVVMAQPAPPAPTLPTDAPPPSLPAPSNAPPPLPSDAPAPSLPAPSDAPPPTLPPPSNTPSPTPPAYVAPPPPYVPPAPPATIGAATVSTYADPNAAPQAPPPAPAEVRGPFSRGQVELTGMIGSTFSSHHSYLILGIGAGYYLLNGLQASLAGSIWFLDSPVSGTITPGVNYVLHMVPVLKPYVGAFYRHYIIGDNYKDLNSVGARLGLYLMPRPTRSYFGIGAVFETLFDCDSKVRACNSVYPEVTIAISL